MHSWSLMELFSFTIKANISQYEQIVAGQKCTFKSIIHTVLAINLHSFFFLGLMYHCTIRNRKHSYDFFYG
jgi:hypothetical protein